MIVEGAVVLHCCANVAAVRDLVDEGALGDEAAAEIKDGVDGGNEEERESEEEGERRGVEELAAERKFAPRRARSGQRDGAAVDPWRPT